VVIVHLHFHHHRHCMRRFVEHLLFSYFLLVETTHDDEMPSESKEKEKNKKEQSPSLFRIK